MKRLAIAAIIASVALVVVGVKSWEIAVSWLLGIAPREHHIGATYGDIPPLRVPAHLEQGVPIEFRARITSSRNYELNLLVYFGSKEERSVVERLIGTRHVAPGEITQPVSEMPTTVRVVVRNQSGHELSDQTIHSDGRLMTAADYLGRGLAVLPLDEGTYFISVTPLRDVPALRSFRVEFELNAPPA
ncbi:hypothetical protein ACVMIH_002507 [Bradyrhizobium sp. USDA 4503]